MDVERHKIFLIVLICICALTHHLPKISASASDLSSSTKSSLPLLSSSVSSSPAAVVAAATSSSLATTKTNVTIPQSSGGGGNASAKTVSIAYDENSEPAKEISITAPSTSLSSSASSSSPGGETGPENLATRRKIRSIFFPYGAGLYNNLYIGYGAGAAYYYYPSSYSYAYYPTFNKYWGVYNPYYGYPRIIYS